MAVEATHDIVQPKPKPAPAPGHARKTTPNRHPRPEMAWRPRHLDAVHRLVNRLRPKG